ncbi:MAG: PIN domain-containing protein [Clostridia bacterium]|nr:PIN domain-containing protein [Clostridia bacterium]
MLKKVFRIITILCGMLVGFGITSYSAQDEVLGLKWGMSASEKTLWILTGVAFFGFIFDYLFSIFQGRGEDLAHRVDRNLRNIPAAELATGSIGLVIGLVIAFLISQIINEIEILQTAYINVVLTIALYFLFGSIGITTASRISKEVPRLMPVNNPIVKESTAKSKGKGAGVSPKILDTSVIIDGRIADILKTGFIDGNIIIPDFVLVELRHIADSSDSLKRNRGRRGLDVLNKIQSEYGIEIYDTTSEKSLDEIPEVDVKLLKLAQIMKGKVVTNDFNLNKVATITGIGVLNINELANTLKPVVLPGEEMQVFLVKEGKENNQGVGYLDDGTMIVVEDGRKFIGQNINVAVTSVLQTSAGRMIFVKPASLV